MCLHSGRPKQAAGRNENGNPARVTASFMDTPTGVQGVQRVEPSRGRAAPACGQTQAGRDKFQHLRENRIMMGHGLNLLVVTGLAATSIVTTR